MPRVTLTTDHLWRGTLYLAGDRDIPEDLAIALGTLETDNTQTSIAEPGSNLTSDPALLLLNSANYEHIATLPTIGEKSAIRIAENMPDEGYTSIEECAEINGELTWIDWKQVKAAKL